jgi:hypothetical protein
MVSGSGDWQHEVSGGLVAQTTRSTGSGTTQHTMTCRLDLGEIITSSGSGNWQHALDAALTTFKEPTPPGPERWDAPVYSFVGDAG